MRLLIIRHGDPDYANDTLTEKGRREAELLKERLLRLDIKAFYCSPLGRAKATAEPTIKAMGREMQVCNWLQEFSGYIKDEKTGEHRIPWDLMPSYWTKDDRFYDKSTWLDTPIMKSGNVSETYIKVSTSLDELLKNHGYVREGNVYRVEKENRDTIVLFCHFGLKCVLLSHILGISPVLIWHGFVALPTSVTTLVTEEREQGIAYFRCQSFGDLSHLALGGEPASFSARFCENYSNFDERH